MTARPPLEPPTTPPRTWLDQLVECLVIIDALLLAALAGMVIALIERALP